VNSVYGLTVDW